MKPTTLRSTREIGQNLVEFALVFPLLLLILFGIIDLGRAFYVSITISNASREGARYAISYPDDDLGIQTATEREASNSGIDLTDLAKATFDISCPDGCGSGNAIQVTVTYKYEVTFLVAILGSELNLIGSTQMMVP